MNKQQLVKALIILLAIIAIVLVSYALYTYFYANMNEEYFRVGYDDDDDGDIRRNRYRRRPRIRIGARRPPVTGSIGPTSPFQQPQPQPQPTPAYPGTGIGLPPQEMPTGQPTQSTSKPTQPSQPTQPTQPSQPSSSSSSVWVNEHNRVRANVNQGAVSWNDQIAQGAQSYAARCQFQHSAQTDRMLGQTQLGENLAWGSPYESYDDAKMVKMWEDEKNQYTYPAGPSSATGHYTQIVNKGVKQIGCGCAKCDNNTSKMCVCRYDFAQYANEPPY